MNAFAPAIAEIPEISNAFDEYDEMKVGAVVPSELVKPVQELLISLATAEMAERIDGLDKARAFDLILQELKKLREACIDRWRDI